MLVCVCVGESKYESKEALPFRNYIIVVIEKVWEDIMLKYSMCVFVNGLLYGLFM